jgi:hypothetical protein
MARLSWLEAWSASRVEAAQEAAGASPPPPDEGETTSSGRCLPRAGRTGGFGADANTDPTRRPKWFDPKPGQGKVF